MLPKITVVIPNLNCAEYLERTIRSVLAQGYPNLELIAVDGGSNDGSLDILRRYRDRFSALIVGPDTGQADALNKGFARATGQVLSWINSDDMLMPGALRSVGEVFASHEDINWILGNSTVIEADDRLRRSRPAQPHTRRRFLAGSYQWVQQESCFWRRALWEQAGGRLDDGYRLAVDGELWLRFFRHADLVPVRARLGAFRIRRGQRSEAIDAYHAEMRRAIGGHRDMLAGTAEAARFADVLARPLETRSEAEALQLFSGLDRDDVQPLRLKPLPRVFGRRVWTR